MQEYKHRRLNTSSTECRLLRIKKSRDESSPIHITLRHAYLDVEGEKYDVNSGEEEEIRQVFTRGAFGEKRGFNALSYAWGAEHPTDDAMTGSFRVRQSLYDFLCNVRRLENI